MGKLQLNVPWRGLDGPFMTAGLAVVGNVQAAERGIDSNRYATRLTLGTVRLSPLITRHEIGHCKSAQSALEREAVSACTASNSTWMTARSLSTSRRVSVQYSFSRGAWSVMRRPVRRVSLRLGIARRSSIAI